VRADAPSIRPVIALIGAFWVGAGLILALLSAAAAAMVLPLFAILIVPMCVSLGLAFWVWRSKGSAALAVSAGAALVLVVLGGLSLIYSWSDFTAAASIAFAVAGILSLGAWRERKRMTDQQD